MTLHSWIGNLFRVRGYMPSSQAPRGEVAAARFQSELGQTRRQKDNVVLLSLPHSRACHDVQGGLAVFAGDNVRPSEIYAGL